MTRVRVEVLPWLTDTFGAKRSSRVLWEEEIEDNRLLRDLVLHLAQKYPSFGAVVYNPQADVIRDHVNVIINDSMMELVGGLEAPIRNGDLVTFLPAYTGG